ncbi:hypothetical protein PUNSTDRAFT_118664 [Punctularia strigosozonata HHB-11173 SS5]|uniref:uncharacterized protein n=1 Tax=Punctularia strigosozonata (strain HHB-11173) TaxID=741275 RepID=UPI0004416293|nr:uncharacterized protein PUNSTDRAFT_118664 [Punctularia strigosozonata HHB-11173 SS5]EIN13076.1 hypothetical protein PUNSTDRAFT_118664 [Punctularia strigosozonata HHB-11173 SS5]
MNPAYAALLYNIQTYKTAKSTLQYHPVFAVSSAQHAHLHHACHLSRVHRDRRPRCPQRLRVGERRARVRRQQARARGLPLGVRCQWRELQDRVRWTLIIIKSSLRRRTEVQAQHECSRKIMNADTQVPVAARRLHYVLRAYD